MEFNVSRISSEMVAPSQPTPIGTTLELSVIDKLDVLRCNARTLHLFKHGPSDAKPAQIIRRALSNALVPYYPLAGKLCVSSAEDGIQIACTGDGVWFVEAVADCNLDAVSCCFDDATSLSTDFPYEKFLPPPPPQPSLPRQEYSALVLSDPLVQMQVTNFKCGGFVIGLIFCHSVCDGLGAAQFLNAVGQVAKGGSTLSLNPLPQWHRDFLKQPPQPKMHSFPPPPPQLPIHQDHNHEHELVHATLDISLERIKQLKQQFQEHWGEGGNSTTTTSRCSAFELVAAILWMERTRAVLSIKHNIETRVLKLVFFANCRHLVDPPLPDGFYGNCFFPVTAHASASVLVRTGECSSTAIFEVVKLIQQAKADLPNQFAEWRRRHHNNDDDDSNNKPTSSRFSDPFAPPHELEYATDLFISEWGRLGFNEVDYGWGKPVHVVPIQGSSIIPVAIVCTPPSPKKAIRLMTWCVRRPHLQPLLQNISNYVDSD